MWGRFSCPIFFLETVMVLVRWSFLLCLMWLAGCAAAGPPQSSESSASAPVVQDFLSPAEQALGVRVEAIRLVSAGYMVDFRFRVLDSQKAQPLADRRMHPYLVHQKTGAYLGIPAPAKIGSLRQKPRSYYPDRVYFMLFANPGGLVKQGDRVTVVAGDYRFENLVVE
ncbi:MAG: hypothetical protein D6751_11295 [Deltaproteobacteria bacterium]|nr:MAG: hypothetical protein D6751_11295 [Deltaproteobacteria bacterium]